jgi:hypothetical protein
MRFLKCKALDNSQSYTNVIPKLLLRELPSYIPSLIHVIIKSPLSTQLITVIHDMWYVRGLPNLLWSIGPLFYGFLGEFSDPLCCSPWMITVSHGASWLELQAEYGCGSGNSSQVWIPAFSWSLPSLSRVFSHSLVWPVQVPSDRGQCGYHSSASSWCEASAFHLCSLSDRVFRFSVYSPAVGFHIYKLRSFAFSQFKVFFNL